MASQHLEKVKKMDQRTKDCVYGYIRVCQELLFQHEENVYYIIPTLVIHWCLLYYSSIERFALFKPNSFEVDENGKIARSINTGMSAVFLKEIVNSGRHS